MKIQTKSPQKTSNPNKIKKQNKTKNPQKSEHLVEKIAQNVANEFVDESTNNFQITPENHRDDWSMISSGPESTYYKYNILYHSICNLSVKQKRKLFGIIRGLNSENDGHIFFPQFGFTVGEFSIMQICIENQNKNQL
jgi:hypothetical protein